MNQGDRGGCLATIGVVLFCFVLASGCMVLFDRSSNPHGNYTGVWEFLGACVLVAIIFIILGKLMISDYNSKHPPPR
jgi:uncharacterized membrane protein YvlD (DUF360 family)